MASTEVEHASGVDSADVPSANWGWSKINHRNWRIVGLCIVGLLLAMLDGNHVGHIENLYLIGFAAVVLFFVVRDWWGRRRGWLRSAAQPAVLCVAPPGGCRCLRSRCARGSAVCRRPRPVRRLTPAGW